MVEQNGPEDLQPIVITEPYQLDRDTQVTFRHSHVKPTYFFFDLSGNEKVIIDSSEETYCTRSIDVYVSTDIENGQAGPDNYKWKSEYGPNQVEIDPNTDKFCNGRFHIAYVSKPLDEDQQEPAEEEPVIFTVRLRIVAVPIATRMNDRVEPLAVTLSAPEAKAAYFRYVLPQNVDFDAHWVLIQLSRKSKIAAYIHWRVLPSPSMAQYEQMLGTLPQEKLEELMKSNYRMEYFADAKVFVFNEQTGKVEYKENYDHIPRERLEPANLNTVDGNLLARTINWRPGCVEKMPRYTGSDFDSASDRIDFILNTMYWKDVSDQVMIGIHMSDENDEPVDFTIKVTDFAPQDVYRADLRQKAEIIEGAYRKLDAINTAWDERD